MGTLNGNLVKNLQTQWGRLGGKPGDQLEHLSPIRKLRSFIRGLYRWWKTSQPNKRDWRGKPDKKINQWKNLQNFDEEMWEENKKIIDIIDEKTF